MSNIIYCYSASGNCLDMARKIAEGLGDTDIVMMRAFPTVTDATPYERVGFVFPCHGGGLPADVESHIRAIRVAPNAYKFGVVQYAAYMGCGLHVIDSIVGLDYWSGISNHCSAKCETPHLDEETIKARFVTALNAIIESKDNILEDCRLMQATLTDCTGIDTEIESLLEEIDVVTELTKRCIAENSQTAQNQEEYAARYNGFVERYEKAKAQLEQLRTTKAEREAQAEAIGAFMFEVQELDALTEFDEKLWLTIIDTITVHADGRMTFRFQDGTEIEA